MRRLLRWAFSFAVIVSAVLFVATCVLWVRSYFRMDGVIFETRHGSSLVGTAPGTVYFHRQPQVMDSGITLGGFQFLSVPVDEHSNDMFEGPSFRVAGLKYGHYFTSMAHDAWWVAVPFWWPMLIFSLIPAFRWCLVRKRIA